eukprot:12829_1
MLSKNDALVMHDLTNICQNPNMRNTSTKGTIIRRTPRRTPTGDISMSLRSKTKENVYNIIIYVITRINLCLDKIPVATIRKWFRKMRRYEDAYNGGATCIDILKQVEQLKKQKNHHRGVSQIEL